MTRWQGRSKKCQKEPGHRHISLFLKLLNTFWLLCKEFNGIILKSSYLLLYINIFIRFIFFPFFNVLLLSRQSVTVYNMYLLIILFEKYETTNTSVHYKMAVFRGNSIHVLRFTSTQCSPRFYVVCCNIIIHNVTRNVWVAYV